MLMLNFLINNIECDDFLEIHIVFRKLMNLIVFDHVMNHIRETKNEFRDVVDEHENEFYDFNHLAFAIWEIDSDFSLCSYRET